MKGIVIHFLQFEILNMHPAVYWGLAVVFVLLFASATMSLRSLTIPGWAKLLWFLVIVALPILGLAAYALRCLIRSNWDAFKPLFQSRQLNKQMSTAARSSDPVAKV